MLADHSRLPADGALLSQPPKTGFSCKVVLQAVGRVLRKSKAKPNGKKPAAEEKKMYLEPEYTKSRITDFEFKELPPHFSITSTFSIAPSQNSAQERRARRWLCVTRPGLAGIQEAEPLGKDTWCVSPTGAQGSQSHQRGSRGVSTQTTPRLDVLLCISLIRSSNRGLLRSGEGGGRVPGVRWRCTGWLCGAGTPS
nr:MOB kinase activator 2 isoform X3 [Manis javanica]